MIKDKKYISITEYANKHNIKNRLSVYMRVRVICKHETRHLEDYIIKKNKFFYIREDIDVFNLYYENRKELEKLYFTLKEALKEFYGDCKNINAIMSNHLFDLLKDVFPSKYNIVFYLQTLHFPDNEKSEDLLRAMKKLLSLIKSKKLEKKRYAKILMD